MRCEFREMGTPEADHGPRGAIYRILHRILQISAVQSAAEGSARQCHRLHIRTLSAPTHPIGATPQSACLTASQVVMGPEARPLQVTGPMTSKNACTGGRGLFGLLTPTGSASFSISINFHDLLCIAACCVHDFNIFFQTCALFQMFGLSYVSFSGRD